MKNMKLNYSVSFVCGLLLLATSHVLIGDTVADAPVATDFNGTVTYTYGAPGEITVIFPAIASTARPVYNAVTIAAGSTSVDSPFTGDYRAAGIQAVSFKIEGQSTVSVPVEIRLVLRSSVSGRVWRNATVVASPDAGVVVFNQKTFDRSSGWTRDGSGDLDAMWLEDLRSVEVIGVRLAQPKREGMSYKISEFRLSDSTTVTGDADLSPLEKALKDAFGGKTTLAALTEEENARDSDGDGMTDVVKILSENDDEFANSIFVAEIVEVSDAGILIRWPCVAASRYTIMRSSSLLNPFEDLPGAVSMLTTVTGYMTYLDNTAVDTGPYFYKIRREK